MNIIENAVIDFISKWWNTFVLTFVIASMLMGYLNLVAGYAVIILLLFIAIIKELRKIVALAKQLIEMLDTAPKQ